MGGGRGASEEAEGVERERKSARSFILRHEGQGGECVKREGK